jgi:photosystem II stability/assembly factor-like uncharacterized protein
MHPDNQDTMFVTDSFAGAFKSHDGGQSWFPINNGIDIYGGLSGDAIKVFCLTVDPNNPNILWCGLQDYLGIFKSTNGGNSWIEKTSGIDLGPGGVSIRGITVDPFDSNIVYAAGEISSGTWNDSLISGYEFDKTKGMVYKTVDGGDNWTQIWYGDNLARYIWINPQSTNVLYVSTGILDREAANRDTALGITGGVGILKSTTGGDSWDQINYGLTDLYIGTLFMHPDDPDILLAGSSSPVWPDTSGVFLTTDAGNSWIRVLDHAAQSVEFSLSNPEIAYAGNASAIFRSTDGGYTWVERTDSTGIWGPPGVEAGFPIDFQVDLHDPDRIFTNNYGGGNFLSVDGGRNWTVASKGYTGAHVRDIAVSQDDPGRVYAAARTGVFRSLDFGESWSGRNFAPARENEWNVVTVDPHNSLHVLGAGNKAEAIFFSNDGAETWVSAAGPILGSFKHWRCITFAPAKSGLIYAGTGASATISQFQPELPALGVYRSVDNGESWAPANNTISQYANVADLAVVDSVVVYAATTNQGILKTTDGGGNWTVMNDTLPEPVVLSVAVDPADSSHVFVGLKAAGLYVSFDGGSHWQSVPVGLPAEADVSSIVYSPVDTSVIYVGDLRSGVYRSDDDGLTWVDISYGLRTRAVNALTLSADGQVLYAGTEGEGVYRLVEAPIVDVRDTPPVKDSWLPWSYPNPGRSSVTLVFTLESRVLTTLSVFDISGRLVRTLLDEPRDPGMNRVVWDGRDDGGRSVASGVYFYRLRAGSKDETRKMILAR